MVDSKFYGIPFSQLHGDAAPVWAKKPGTVYATYTWITPLLASRILKCSAKNYRKLDSHRVNAYAASMKEGRWEPNSASISLDPQGEANDGQHRLHACVKAGVGFFSLVVMGLTNCKELDRGKGRKISDHLRFSGEKNVTELASIIRYVHCWEAGYPLYAGGIERCPTVSEAKSILDNHPGIRDAVAAARKAKGIAPASVLGSVSYVGCKTAGLGFEVAHEFCRGLGEGVEGNHDDARHVAREMILRSKRAGATGRYGPRRLLATLIRAWNAFCLGERVNAANLRWRAVGDAAMPFPEFVSESDLYGV